MLRKLLLPGMVIALAACSTTSQPADRPASTPTARDSPVATEHPFEVKGTVKSVGEGLLGMGESLTVARDGAPSAQLKIAERTRITLDDRPVKLSDLREGDEVRALFDFDGATPVAIEIEAKPAKRR
ncbi:hypothetical protein [Anaeromyxobacter sp. Fw109-5]|uniref:hypothetical protein n=1 Tax=Anaeromyxobacter sp. (strain Fw109-5) TaxID=404589 RepID=UPI0000ED70CE|nr:hypothetical protein [Anaeromyxobacter sp. Fw109-5]ABS27697.1 conserved hypothetical protein [Anaeromyxobacter sp. Fw109-5]